MTFTHGAKDFPVVCVGGSAGGLDAYVRLLKCLPPDMGVAIVIVNHLRTVATLLHKILPRYTRMPVELITEGLVLQSNRVFIIPEKLVWHEVFSEITPTTFLQTADVAMPDGSMKRWMTIHATRIHTERGR